MTESLGLRVHGDAPLSPCAGDPRFARMTVEKATLPRPRTHPAAHLYLCTSFRACVSRRRIPLLVCTGNDAFSQNLLSFSRSAAPASDANPAKRIAAEKEEQGSERSFRRKAEAEPSGLCDDAIPPLVAEGNGDVLPSP